MYLRQIITEGIGNTLEREAEQTRIWSKADQYFMRVATLYLSLRVQNKPGRRITARLAFARPPYADAPLWNAEECRGRIVVVARGPRSRKTVQKEKARQRSWPDIGWERTSIRGES